MRIIPHPHLHPTREDSARAQAAEALRALQTSQRDKEASYESSVAHAETVDRYVRQAAPAENRGGPYAWVDPGNPSGAPYATNFAGDQMLVASAAARGLAQNARAHLDAGNFNQAHALARRAQSLAEAAQSALAPGRRAFAPRSLPPLVGRRAAVTSTALAAAGLADLAVVAKHSRAIFSAQGTPAAPGTRLDALMRLSTLAAARSLAAAELADPLPESTGSALGPADLASQFASAAAYRVAIAAAMARAHDGEGAVGHQVYCLKQASTMSDWMLGPRQNGDRQLCQNAMDAAWMRNGLRLEPEVPPPCLRGAGNNKAATSVPQVASTDQAPAWAQ